MLSDHRKNLAALIRDTALRCDDPTLERWSQARLIEAINEATLDLALEARCIVCAVPVTVYKDKQVYDLREENDAYSGKTRDFGFPVRVEYVQDALATVPAPGGRPRLRTVDHPTLDFGGVSLLLTGFPARVTKELLSPNKIAIFPMAGADGSATTLQGNLLAWFVAFPDPMAVPVDYPDDLVSALFHQAIPLGAAARLLCEGNAEDLAMAVQLELEFYDAKMRAASALARGTGMYDSFRPM